MASARPAGAGRVSLSPKYKAMTTVAITKPRSHPTPSSLRDSVAQALSRVCDLREIISPGQTVVLKPNVFAPQRPPTTTDPRVVVAVGELCREAGAGRVIVAEGRSISTAQYRKAQNSTRACFAATGMDVAVEAAGFEVERVRPVRRPAVIRRSFAQLADDTGSRLHRRLATSRLVVGLVSWIALVTRRTGQMMCLARRK